MTNAEKLILKDEKAKKAVTEVLKLFDGESYKFATDCLKSASYFLNVESHFNLKNVLKAISSLDGAKKKSD